MTIGRAQISKQVEGKLRGARDEKKKEEKSRNSYKKKEKEKLGHLLRTLKMV